MTYLEQYARAVLDGKIVACTRIKQVYEQLLNDLYNPKQWHFDEAVANRHIEFIERFCKQSQGKIGQPIKLELFQKAMLQSLFGFVDDCGVRRFNELLCIIGRKNGKTTVMAALELDLLLNDRWGTSGEMREGAPEIYNVATKLDQAKKGFDEAYRMVQHSPSLSKAIRKRQSDLYCPMNMGNIKALSANTNSLDGLNSHAVIIDELAAIKNRDLYDLMKQSMSARTQPILACITTNGFVRDSIFDAQYQYACDILDGRVDNPRFLPIIYELDSADEWKDETAWIKANPGLGTIKSMDFLRECVQKAKDDASFRPTVMVKDFNLKENTASAWLRWDELNNEDTFDLPEFRYCIGGIDAADTTDLNAAHAVMMRKDDDNIYVKSMYWIPETVLERTGKTGTRRERDNAPYELWVKQGWMRTVAGNRVEKSVFVEWFKELKRDYKIYTLAIGFDPWHMDDSTLRSFYSVTGANGMIPVRQGTATLSEPMKRLKAELNAHHVIYENNPITKWCLMNTEIKADINGNIQPVKSIDPRRRIDGTAALLDAYKVLLDQAENLKNLNKRRA